jgi:uncharacterized membrane protein
MAPRNFRTLGVFAPCLIMSMPSRQPAGKLSVVLVATFGVLVLGERPAPASWLGIAMIGCGAALIASKI